MISRKSIVTLAVLGATLAPGPAAAQGQESAPQGQQIFQRQCMTCHTLDPGEHRIGPSLADIFGEKAGTVSGYERYSQALIESDLVWEHDSLDQWIRAPNEVIPGNRMAYPGLKDPQQREALIAYLQAQQVEQSQRQQDQQQQQVRQTSSEERPQQDPGDRAGRTAGAAADAQADRRQEPVVGIGSVERRSSGIPGGPGEIAQPDPR